MVFDSHKKIREIYVYKYLCVLYLSGEIMAGNPLQQYFRQPKIFIGLPSHGVYNKPGAIDGDVEKIPVFGMTGMDEIMIKTPDALLSGESTTSVIASCCSNIKDPWDLASIDLEIILVAIRIATYGNELPIIHTCPHCSAENEYSLDLNKFIEYYAHCQFDNKLVLKDFAITVRPLTYKESTAYALRNFELQQQLKQVIEIEDTVEKQSATNKIFRDLAILKNDIFVTSIESVDIGTNKVDQKIYISEWLENCDSSIIDAISKHIQKNQDTWSLPATTVSCTECNKESKVSVDLDPSSFFVNA